LAELDAIESRITQGIRESASGLWKYSSVGLHLNRLFRSFVKPFAS
jgi:hypothetical protein